MSSLHLIAAGGSSLHIKDYVQAPVQTGDAEVIQQFLVLENLISPVILGLDFMKKHKVTLDFTTSPVSLCFNGINCTQQQSPQELNDMWSLQFVEKSKVFSAAVVNDSSVDVIDECSIPDFGANVINDYPDCEHRSLDSVITKYKDLFHTKPGLTTEATFIPQVA